MYFFWILRFILIDSWKQCFIFFILIRISLLPEFIIIFYKLNISFHFFFLPKIQDYLMTIYFFYFSLPAWFFYTNLQMLLSRRLPQISQGANFQSPAVSSWEIFYSKKIKKQLYHVFLRYNLNNSIPRWVTWVHFSLSDFLERFPFWFLT